jgi:hypothetical protein
MTGPVHIDLLHGLRAIIDHDDRDLVSQYRWWAIRRPGRTYVYGRAKPGDKPVYMHRLLLGFPAGLVVDHINGNGLDNRRANLRACEQRANLTNTAGRSGSSEYKGVCRVRGRTLWRAAIKIGGRTFYIGAFKQEVEAAIAYDLAAEVLHGQFFRPNITDRGSCPPVKLRDAFLRTLETLAREVSL